MQSEQILSWLNLPKQIGQCLSGIRIYLFWQLEQMHLVSCLFQENNWINDTLATKN